jgi:hypothetical protein
LRRQRHREERSDAAIQRRWMPTFRWIASLTLAMTAAGFRLNAARFEGGRKIRRNGAP